MRVVAAEFRAPPPIRELRDLTRYRVQPSSLFCGRHALFKFLEPVEDDVDRCDGVHWRRLELPHNESLTVPNNKSAKNHSPTSDSEGSDSELTSLSAPARFIQELTMRFVRLVIPVFTVFGLLLCALPRIAFGAPPDPCALLTDSQVSAALGVSTGSGKSAGGRICRPARRQSRSYPYNAGRAGVRLREGTDEQP